MLGWLKRAFAPSEPPRPRLEARFTLLENRSDDFESRLDYLASELKKVRGRQFALEKRAQDDPGPTIDERADTELVPRGYSPTAHLARRFKQGG